MTTMETPVGLNQIKAVFGDPGEHTSNLGFANEVWESEILGVLYLPLALPLSWDLKTSVTRCRVHQLLIPTFEAVFDDLRRGALLNKLHTFGGVYEFRRKAGQSSDLSTHSWGIAIDLNVGTCARGTHGNMDPGVVAVFESHGFQWGGRWRPKAICDPQHFQFARGY